MTLPPDSLPQRRELARLGIARADIEATLQLCDAAIQSQLVDNTPLYWAFHNAVVVSYARPFSENYGIGALSTKWHTFSCDRLQVHHRLILDLRDEVVAHADLRRRPIHLVGRGTLLPDGHVTEAPMVAVARVGLNTDSYEAVRELCLDLLPRLNAAFDSAFLHLFPDGYDAAPLELVPEITHDDTG